MVAAGGDATVDSGLAAAFRSQFAEPIEQVLDLATWSTGLDLDWVNARLAAEVHGALVHDRHDRALIREQVFPRLAQRGALVPEAGVYRATIDDISMVHRGLLFNGAVEAADGTVAVHETLPLSVAQIGVSLVSYKGDEGAWVHRLYRRDIRTRATDDPVEEALALLEARHQRGALDDDRDRDPLSALARRSLMSYAERAVLLRKSVAPWRMGHGSPAPLELLTGAGEPFLDASLTVLRELILTHRRFVYIPSTPAERLWLTLGSALQPLEYAVLETSEARLTRFVERGGHSAFGSSSLRAALDFAEEVGPKIVLGMYRASAYAPGQLFYAHVDHIHEAALIALADSVLHEHRGFPLLIDLADQVCAAHFSASAFATSVEAAYSAAGAAYQYRHERATRKG